MLPTNSMTPLSPPPHHVILPIVTTTTTASHNRSGSEVKKESDSITPVATPTSNQLGIYAFGTNKANALVPVYYSITPSSTIALPSFGTPLQHCAAALCGDYVYVMGGINMEHKSMNTMQRYHITSKQWSTCSMLPRDYDHHLAGVLHQPDRIIVVGNEGCDIFDINTQKWMTGPSLLRRHYGACGIPYHSMFYVFGGAPTNYSKEKASTKCEAYDINGHWIPIAPCPSRRACAVAVVVGSSIFVMGGLKPNFFRTDYESVDLVEEYIPSSNRWNVVKWKLPVQMFSFGATYNSVTRQLMIIDGSSTYVRSYPFESHEWIRTPCTIEACATWCYCS
jgi:hypothetical protein